MMAHRMTSTCCIDMGHEALAAAKARSCPWTTVVVGYSPACKATSAYYCADWAMRAIVIPAALRDMAIPWVRMMKTDLKSVRHYSSPSRKDMPSQAS